MPRWQLILEPGGKRLRLTYGWDPHIGFFAVVLRRTGKVEYDALRDNYQGLPGFLDFLITSEVFNREQVEDALDALLVVEDPADIEDEPVRQVAEIILNLKLAAAE